MESLLPRLPSRYADYRAPAPAIGEKRGEVFFFYGCIQDAFLADVNAATVRVLQRNGYTVHFPAGQTCCGAAALHVGEEENARALARQNIASFRGDRIIVNNAGGCGTALKEYAHWLRDDPQYAESAKQFVARVQDVNEFLAEHLRVPPRGVLKVRVTYADSCHLRNAQKVINQPRALLKQIPGVELVELKQPERCCGSAGVYNIAQAQTADAILAAKMLDIAGTGAQVIVTSNTGCHLQLSAGVRRAGLSARVAHVVELVDEAYAAER
jgi:glycolate oxidase iron-sulfur subunit